MVCIYKITSPSSKVYIGQTWNFKRRKLDYKSSSGIKFQVALYNSIKKYGFDTHRFEIVHELPKDITQSVLDNYEIFYWEQYKSLGFSMLNIKEPGSGGRHSEETKEKMRYKRSLQIFTQESRNKMSSSAKKRDYTSTNQRLEKFRGKGSSNPRATLTDEQVTSIRFDYLSGVKRKDIVIKYNTTKSIIDNICSGRTWTNLIIR